MDGDREATATRKTREEIDREADENRKEALLASTQSLQPNFNRSNLTHKQISKLQVTHRIFTRDVCKLKAIQRSLRNLKQARILRVKQWKMAKTLKKLKQSSSSSPSTLQEEHHHKTVVTVPKKPQKLYWGLDTRERWERKANM